jgi:hypothetical protein
LRFVWHTSGGRDWRKGRPGKSGLSIRCRLQAYDMTYVTRWRRTPNILPADRLPGFDVR